MPHLPVAGHSTALVPDGVHRRDHLDQLGVPDRTLGRHPRLDRELETPNEVYRAALVAMTA
jgi:hypothetical protein